MSLSEKELLQKAYSECIKLGKNHYENFTVLSSLIIPKKLRHHIAAIYAYCRTVDDLGDESHGNRLEQLAIWEKDFLKCYDGKPENIYLIALQETITTFNLPKDPFLKLIIANKMDQTKIRYANFEELLNYCDHSANPVGELYLALHGYRDSTLQKLSNFVCTGLQLTNFWQDVKRDYLRDRIYIPAEDMAFFHVKESDLEREQSGSNLCELIEYQIKRTKNYFEKGTSLLDHLKGDDFKSNEKLNLLLFILGGQSIIKAIEQQQFDVLTKRPEVGELQKCWILIKAWSSLKFSRRI